MTESSAELLDDDWVQHHFDPHLPDLGQNLHPTLARARAQCPVTRSDKYDGGFWVVTDYQDIMRIAQDWKTFSSADGITVPHKPIELKIVPVMVDPPVQREFRSLTNPYFRPAVIGAWEKPTRDLVTRLIDNFIADGECDFMSAFARPLPGLSFFELALHAPLEDLEEVNKLAMLASQPYKEESDESHMKLAGWIAGFLEKRREEGPRGDVVDAVLSATIGGEPISFAEAIGTIHLLILGGLDTTAGVLGMALQRFCENPEIPARLREQPELIPAAVEELLRMDNSFICVGRTAREDVEVGGKQIKAGERVMMYWASANRDEAEFDHPDTFDLERTTNRHLAFGAGPHRCAGSNLARMNLRIALEELLPRLHDIRLAPGADIHFHSTFNRSPLAVPITFTPGERSDSAQ